MGDKEKRYYNNHREEILAKRKLWNKEHSEEFKSRYKKSYQKHKEERKKKSHNYYLQNKEKMLANSKLYEKTHLRPRSQIDRKIEKRKELYQNLRKKILEKYGFRCANPNCLIPRDKLDVRCLQIDHVNNNGYEELKQFYCTTNPKFLKKVLDDTEGNYQLLCAYCNWLKRFELKIYPLMIYAKKIMEN
jgi:hypothetical protein